MLCVRVPLCVYLFDRCTHTGDGSNTVASGPESSAHSPTVIRGVSQLRVSMRISMRVSMKVSIRLVCSKLT